ncbi:MAG TPA: bifunctional DNA-formamidopyrimidine glycosylase/DNA-(apurinic or apyrimidinic site) lyase [bacterium]|nr:bifunctional DNA-formamidopyrimidine glycosylase/DNA-(apurinic or apyrimidinic site) lyase [bacterium]
MPELPEVETIKLGLRRLIVNNKIDKVEVNLSKQIKNPLKYFLKNAVGVKIKQIKRRAKNLLLELSNGYFLVFHLKMTGQLTYRSKKGSLVGGGHPIKQDLKTLPNKYSHVIFTFENGAKLFFNDTRQFGWVKLVNKKELEQMLQKIGPELLDESLTVDKFGALLAKKKTAIKPLLMEQSFVAGIGNIYATEACFCAGIGPQRPANSLNVSETKKLLVCLKKILKLAIAKKGTSVVDYVDALGEQGKMSNFLKVYGRAGQPCLKCGAALRVMKQAQRATVFCAQCQK